jgi:hypothetical protein
MAIYRIKSKIFTRAEKELIKQVWRKTKGLRELSGGVTNLEDAKALKNLSGQLSSDGQVEITPEIRKALDNLGFTKATEGTINKMKSKYENKAVADRLRKIQESELEKKIKPGEDIFDYLERTISDKDLKRTKQTYRLQEQAYDEYCYLKSGCQVDPSLSRFYRKKLGGTVLKADNSDSAFATFKSGNENLTMGELKEIAPEAKRITKKDLENFNKNGHLIHIPNDTPRGTVLHEIGHVKSRKEFGRPAVGWKNPFYGIDTIAEENMASANALHVLRNQKGVEKDKELLDKALSTYTLDLRKRLDR